MVLRRNGPGAEGRTTRVLLNRLLTPFRSNLFYIFVNPCPFCKTGANLSAAVMWTIALEVGQKGVFVDTSVFLVAGGRGG